MALRAALTATTLIPVLALAGCGDGDPDESRSAEAGPGYDDGAMDPGAGDGRAGASQEEDGPAVAAETARGGDAVTVAGETERGPAVEAVARRFDLSNADTIILPTLYRAQADITSSQLEIDRSQGDLGFITVSGSVDPDAVMERPRDGLAFELTEDRVSAFLGAPVIITFVARMGEDWASGDERPALRAAWMEPDGDGSGWRAMNLTRQWQKAVFAYDSPSDATGTHLLTIVPPEDQPVDIAAVAIRAQGAADVPEPGGSRDAREVRPMRPEALPQDAGEGESDAPREDGSGAREDG